MNARAKFNGTGHTVKFQQAFYLQTFKHLTFSNLPNLHSPSPNLPNLNLPNLIKLYLITTLQTLQNPTTYRNLELFFEHLHIRCLFHVV